MIATLTEAKARGIDCIGIVNSARSVFENVCTLSAIRSAASASCQATGEPLY